MSDPPYTLLVCTVGGTPEPIVTTLRKWKPSCARFVVSRESRSQLDTVLKEYFLGPGQYRMCPVDDAQDLGSCLRVVRSLGNDVREWLDRDRDYELVADFTAGTKCMSVALALEARRWTCHFSYVGGTERTKGGVGTVETGSERIVHSANPWEELGFQAIDDFITLFDQGALQAAAKLVRLARPRVAEPRKREFTVLEHLAEGFRAWERFDHKTAKQKFDEVLKATNDFKAAVGMEPAHRVVKFIERYRPLLEQLESQTSSPTKEHIIDLLANAQRRREEGRFDDAIARLYRAIEATAQEALACRHNIPNTGKVATKSLPQSFRETLRIQSDGNDVIQLGLQDAYRLLKEVGDELGMDFASTDLSDPQRSPLSARNNSILAHGFQRLSEEQVENLWKPALQLARVTPADLPAFPRLGGGSEAVVLRKQ